VCDGLLFPWPFLNQRPERQTSSSAQMLTFRSCRRSISPQRRRTQRLYLAETIARGGLVGRMVPAGSCALGPAWRGVEEVTPEPGSSPRRLLCQRSKRLRELAFAFASQLRFHSCPSPVQKTRERSCRAVIQSAGQSKWLPLDHAARETASRLSSSSKMVPNAPGPLELR